MKQEKLLSPRKHPVQDRSIFLVEAINEAAIQVFVKNGYHSTTTTMIAKRAGVSVGSLYQYYPNKDAIIVRIMQLMVDDGLEQVIDAIKIEENEDYSPIEILRIFTESLLNAYLRNAPLLKIVFEDAPHPQSLVHQFHKAINKIGDRLKISLSRCGLAIYNNNFNLARCFTNIISGVARWYSLEEFNTVPVEKVVESTNAMIIELASRLGKVQTEKSDKIANVQAGHRKLLPQKVADLFDFIGDRGEVSMAECGANFPQSRRTLQRYVKILLEAGLIQEIKTSPTDPGKRYRMIIAESF